MNSETQTTIINVNDELYQQFISFLGDDPDRVFRITPRECAYVRFLQYYIGDKELAFDYVLQNKIRFTGAQKRRVFLLFDPTSFPVTHRLTSLISFILLHKHLPDPHGASYTAKQLLDLLPPTLDELPKAIRTLEAIGMEIIMKEEHYVRP
ncbi:MAG: hypothetical protein QXD59_02985 [Candidatus Caldarchaeum sp.]